MQTWGAILGFFLSAFSVEWTLVNLHPLGLESRGVVGIHERQPGYLPNYNGIFSIHALNFTASTDTPQTGGSQQLLANTSLSTSEGDGENRLIPSDDPETKLFPEDGTSANEVDSEDRPKPQEQTTFPQLHIVTQTVSDVTTEEWEQTVEETEPGTTVEKETTTELDHTGSETLLEGTQDEEDATGSEDIFDRLMRTIQGHWLDFVGKMKFSVLDVWKSISHHMMERLESFATDL